MPCVSTKREIMKKLTLFIALFFVLSTTLTACDTDNNLPRQETPDNNENNETETENKSMKLKVTIGDVVLTATLTDNPTAKDFISLLPLTVKLDDYANSEKIFYPERKLSTQGAGSINAVAGDITYYSPWGNVAIFYKDFGQSSSLIRIGKFDGNIEVLKKSGSIDNVKFELQEEE